MKHFWMGVSLSCASGSALSLWRQHYDAAFVIGTMGALAWFLNYRARMKEIIEQANDDDSRPSDED
ncbi:MAG: hypothetical protein M3R68_02905 [Acidobacteriota bacterium]|nr:hypothetical protein [Acidobacteriota bacterium]